MHSIISDGDTLFRLFEDFWGYKAKIISKEHERKAITAVLYDTFVMESSFYARYGMHEYGLLLNAQRPLGFLREASVGATQENILECYRVHDQYCRTMLPDKYLKAYDLAYCDTEGRAEMGIMQQINLWVRGRKLAYQNRTQDMGADMSATEKSVLAQERRRQAELYALKDCIDRWLWERKLGRCRIISRSFGYVQFDVYDAFTFRYDDRPRLQMGGFIDGINDIELTGFLGQTPTGTTEAEVIHALEVVSEYCRLRLPDKYLTAYEQAAKTWEQFSPETINRAHPHRQGN